MCNWDGTAAAGLRCVAVDKADCDTEDAAINAALPYSETVTVSASDYADTEAADSASCTATGSVGGGCAYTSGVQEACAAQPDSDVALIFDGMTTGQLVSRLGQDLQQMLQPLNWALSQLLQNLLSLGGGLFMCLFVSWKLSMLAFPSIFPVRRPALSLAPPSR